ncbi:MAG: amino acid permease, partial [bacterium]|nr:amino acid permease [bacterium]
MTSPSLRRSLTTTDAVFIGLGSMIGAGVFAVFPAAARSAGGWLLLGLVIAGVVAFANATSSAQLAARYPTSGGTYAYGTEVLGPRWGFAAGWCFLIGKSASVAAMALTFAAYVAPAEWRGPVAAAAVAVLAAVNYVGVTRTALLTKVFVVITLAALVTAIAGMAGTIA